MLKSPESPKKYTPEEIADLEKSQTIFEAELLKGGAEYEIDEKGHKHLVATEEQKNKLHSEMERDIKNRQETIDENERQEKLWEKIFNLNLERGAIIRVKKRKEDWTVGNDGFVFSRLSKNDNKIFFFDVGENSGEFYSNIKDIMDMDIETDPKIIDNIKKGVNKFGPFKDGTTISCMSYKTNKEGQVLRKYSVKKNNHIVVIEHGDYPGKLVEALQSGETLEEYLKKLVETLQPGETRETLEGYLKYEDIKK